MGIDSGKIWNHKKKKKNLEIVKTRWKYHIANKVAING